MHEKKKKRKLPQEENTCEEMWSSPRKKKIKKSKYFDTKKTPHACDESDDLPHCRWGGEYKQERIINSCRIDNFLLMFHYLISNCDHIKKWLQASTVQVAQTLLDVSEKFGTYDYIEGKLIWIKEFNFSAMVRASYKEYNLYGTEVLFFVKHYCGLQEHVSQKMCTNPRCKQTERRGYDIILT